MTTTETLAERETMKALTIWQPYASLCVLTNPDTGQPFKTIETRSWKAPDKLIGQRIAIHAAAKTSGWGRRGTRTQMGDFEIEYDASGLLLRGPVDWPYRLPTSAVIATAVLADCLPMVEDVGAGPVPADCIELSGGSAYLWLVGDGEEPRCSVRDQIPYGNYKVGYWGWVLEDVVRVTSPIPATGKQGLWNWDGTST